jgi:hypothetical protein
MMACRRNNKTEKRKRNREYARKFQSKVRIIISTQSILKEGIKVTLDAE